MTLQRMADGLAHSLRQFAGRVELTISTGVSGARAQPRGRDREVHQPIQLGAVRHERRDGVCVEDTDYRSWGRFRAGRRPPPSRQPLRWCRRRFPAVSQETLSLICSDRSLEGTAVVERPPTRRQAGPDVRQPLGGVVNREDGYRVIAVQTIDDAIRPFDDFPDGAALELRNDSPGLREVPQKSDSPNQTSDDAMRS